MTDNNPYIIIDEVTMAKTNELLNVARKMAEKSYPHMVDDYDRIINRIRETAVCFTGSQNMPKTHPAYKIEGSLGKRLEKKVTAKLAPPTFEESQGEQKPKIPKLKAKAKVDFISDGIKFKAGQEYEVDEIGTFFDEDVTMRCRSWEDLCHFRKHFKIGIKNGFLIHYFYDEAWARSNGLASYDDFFERIEELFGKEL